MTGIKILFLYLKRCLLVLFVCFSWDTIGNVSTRFHGQILQFLVLFTALVTNKRHLVLNLIPDTDFGVSHLTSHAL